jgi:hypothetical protein
MGIDARYDADTPDGIHFRIAYSPILGFPLHPVPVFRSWANEVRSATIDWYDSRGNRQPAGPVNVNPDNPVTGYLQLNPSQRALWLRIDLAAGASVQVEPLAESAVGPLVVATRSAAPFDFGGSHINRVRVRGSGQIVGATVVSDWSREQEQSPVDLLGLPSPADVVAPFYIGVPDANARAEKRVRAGTPKRFGRHEAHLSLPGPLLPADEVERTAAVRSRLAPLIQRAIDPPADRPPHMDAYEVVRDNQRFSVNPFGHLMTAAVDPGVARDLGLLGIDDPPVTNPERQAYVAFLVWAVHSRAGWHGQNRFERALDRLAAPADPNNPDGDAVVKRVLQALEPYGRDGDLRNRLLNLPAGWEWRAMALPFVVALKAMPDVPQPGFPGPPKAMEWTPGTHGAADTFGAFIPVQPRPSAAYALTRQGVQTVGLTPSYQVPGGRLGKRGAQIVIGLSTGLAESGLNDRAIPAADAGSAKWRLAEMDPFGQWSQWKDVPVPLISRPRPPVPALQVQYKAPEGGGAGPLAGTFTIVAEVPGNRGLPAGGQPIKELAITTNWTLFSQPVTPGTVATIQISGPPLTPAATATATFSAKFVDIDARESPPSAPVSRPIADPRPPVHVSFARNLNLTGHRDACGKAATELTWQVQPGQSGFRIFFATEAALRGALVDPQVVTDRTRADALLAALAAATTRADRAGLIVDQRDLFPRDVFELLNSAPVTSGYFRHAVSGSLRDVLFYRIVAVGAQGVECDFASSGLAAVGVPDDRRPSAPVLSALPNQAGLRITAPPGPERVAEYRIRRTRIGLADQRAFQVMAVGAVPSAGPGDPQTVDWSDSETPPFVRVTYLAEVRYAPEPGTDRGREWSQPSNPVTWIQMPQSAPSAVPANRIMVSRAGIGANVAITDIRPPDLDLIGPFILELYRRKTTGGVALLDRFELKPTPPGHPVEKFDPDATGVSAYELVLIDPLGRASPPTSVPLA